MWNKVYIDIDIFIPYFIYYAINSLHNLHINHTFSYLKYSNSNGADWSNVESGWSPQISLTSIILIACILKCQPIEKFEVDISSKPQMKGSRPTR